MSRTDFDVVTGPSMPQPQTQAPPPQQINRLPEPAAEPPAPSRASSAGRGSR